MCVKEGGGSPHQNCDVQTEKGLDHNDHLQFWSQRRRSVYTFWTAIFDHNCHLASRL